METTRIQRSGDNGKFSRKTSGTRVPFARLLNDFCGIVPFKRKSTK